ncbi:phage tail protein [Vibrio furnissii]|uniref:phage tail-collar fiber domain-containing protein n=1 Tax=Vibrio furnissii TaxID=29494 RepID=UPI003747D38B
MATTNTLQVLTKQGEELLARLAAEERELVIDKFIFADVPDRADFPDREEGIPTAYVVHEEPIGEKGRLTENSVIYTATLASNIGPFEFNWSGLYCSEHDVLITVHYPKRTPKTADQPGIAGNTLVRSQVLQYTGVADITNITVEASTWQYNANDRMKKMDSDVAQAIVDQNGKDWFIDDGFQVMPKSDTAVSIMPGAGYVSGNRVSLAFERMVSVPVKPAFIYIDAHREGTPTGEQTTTFSFVASAQELDDYTDAAGVKHFVCKLGEMLEDGSVSNLRPEGESADKRWVSNEATAQTDMLSGNGGLINDPGVGAVFSGEERIQINDADLKSKKLWYPWNQPKGELVSFVDNNDYGTATLVTNLGEFEYVTDTVRKYRNDKDVRGWGANKDDDVSNAVEKALIYTKTIKFKDQDYIWIREIQTEGTINLLGVNSKIEFQPELPGTSKIIHGESVNINGLVVDGGNKADRAVVAEKSLVCLDTKFNNFWHDSAVRVLHVNNGDYIYLYRTEFNNIGALGNGVAGSGNGSVRCVWINGGNNLQGTIIDCKFNHIVNRLQDGTLQKVEDADAIVLQASSEGFNVANLRIMNSKFANCQKRCVKSQMSEATTVDMINNIIVDTIGVPSSESNPDHSLMLAVVSVYGGSLYYENNRFIKGYCAREIDVAEYQNTNGIKTPILDIEIRAGRFANQFSAYSGESQTRSLLISTTKEVSPDCHVTISGGKRNPGSLPGKIVADTIVIDKGLLKGRSFELEAHSAIDIDGTIVQGSGDNAGMIISKSPVTTVTKLITSNVTYGIYYGSGNNELEDFSATHTGCVFGTNMIADLGISNMKTEHQARVTNTSAVTKRGNFDRVVSATHSTAMEGEAMDIPLKPAFYKREFVNGDEYRVPYFNVSS